MKKTILRVLCLMLALVLVAGISFTAVPAQATEPVAPGTRDTQGDITLHCWNWSFNEITANMERIAALGYTVVQTSPIQVAKQATKEYPSNDWWVFYQPADFVIDNTGNSALGTKADFVKMCETAHKYGLRVIVDVVANHMGNATANDLAETINPDIRNDSSCWHDYSKNTSNYYDRYDVTQHCMAGLPDLNTSSKKVQNYVVDVLKECIDAGADGFRFDGAKHIETPDDGKCASDFWPTVINAAKEYYSQKNPNSILYCYGEVLDSPGGTLSISSYTKYMSVTDNGWGNTVLQSVIKNKNANAYSASYQKSASADKLVVWAESHDTFADGTTSKISDADIAKAWALVGARSQVTPLYLARPANMSQYLGAASVTGWASPEVAAVNHFHNNFFNASEYVAKEGGIAYVERGNSGVVLVNTQGGEVNVSVSSHIIADGTYTDAITGNKFTVSGGKISGKIGASGIAVVYEADACAHATHTTEGMCNACSAQVEHSFDAKGKCACGASETVYRTVYFINNRGWNTVNFYSWYTPTDIFSDAWPGSPMTKVEGNIYSCEVPADIPNIIFNNSQTQTTDLTLPDLASGKNLYDFTTNTWSTYTDPNAPADPGPSDPEDPSDPSDPSVPSEPANPADPTVPTVPADPSDPSGTTAGTSESTKDTSSKSHKNNNNDTPEGINPIIWIVIAVAVVGAGAVIVVFVLKKKK